jgi:hypothetical protein
MESPTEKNQQSRRPEYLDTVEGHRFEPLYHAAPEVEAFVTKPAEPDGSL